MNNIVLTSISLEELVEAMFQKFHTLSKNKRKFNNLKPAEKLYLTKKEVMELCGITSPSTLWNWKKKGLLVPRARAGRKPLYLRSDVIDFLNGTNKNSNK